MQNMPCTSLKIDYETYERLIVKSRPNSETSDYDYWKKQHEAYKNEFLKRCN